MAKILVVQESAGVLTGDLAAGVLEGHEPHVVPTAVAAVAALEAEAYDAVLLAAPLPIGDGVVLAACMRADSTLSRLPLVELARRGAA